jgi:DNA-binding CsgD family transcriptional regulator
MSEPERPSDSQLLKWLETREQLFDELEVARLAAARLQASDEAGASIARQLNGPLTALLLYMGEIKLHSHQFSQTDGTRIYLQQVVENALQQTERVCALMKGFAGPDERPAMASSRKAGAETPADLVKDGVRTAGVMFGSDVGLKPLTPREREVLGLISEGCSNKQGALRMQISPRTFESHRAEAMRKLGARNTAELVRSALLHPSEA